MRRIFRRLAFLLLSVVMLFTAANASAGAVVVTYAASDAELVNPFIGSAAWANDDSERQQPFTLVYASLTWVDFEPEEGVYDFEAFEEANHFDLWREQGKHVIFRFVLDMPGEKKHRDIPDWLWEKTDKDGEAYNISYGRGYSPNYANPVLIEAHAKAIAALGQRYGNDPFIAYVELGSLGHWGEWHVHDDLNPLPLLSVRDLYVEPYLSAFPSAKIMMRRPFAIAALNGMGIYNDTAGALESTQTWLTWIQEGGIYDQTGEENAIVPMPEAWRAAPIGGELSTHYEPEELLGEMLDNTLSLFAESHTSWIGPGSFVKIERGGEFQSELDQVNRRIGYRLRVSRSEVSDSQDGKLQMTVTWENDGIAPFYFDWTPCLCVTGSDGSRTILPLDMRLGDVQPDTSVPVSLSVDENTLPKGECVFYAGIVNPDTGDAGIELAMSAPQDGLWYELFRFMVQ